jgi:hypothetical protein
MTKTEHWKPEPDDHDYPAAADYLSLTLSDSEVKATVEALKAATLTHRKAKDLLRASSLPPQSPDNVHVAKDLKKVKSSQKLSPTPQPRGRRKVGVPAAVLSHQDDATAESTIAKSRSTTCQTASRSTSQ